MMLVYFLVFIFLFSSNLLAVNLVEDTIVYKKIENKEYCIYVTSDKDNKNLNKPCMLMFFGGGWNSRNINQFKILCNYFAERGYVSIRADYRVTKKDNSTPFQSLEDAKSAMRYVRSNANKLGINPQKIAVGGGSAGGHLAAACATIDKFNDKKDDLSVSCIPNALLLFNPVIDNGPAGYGYERVGNAYKDFSPLHNLCKGMPPTIFFLGTKDKLIPVETAEYFQKSMSILDSKCELHLYEGQEHGFFNKDKYRKITIGLTEVFLRNLNW